HGCRGRLLHHRVAPAAGAVLLDAIDGIGFAGDLVRRLFGGTEGASPGSPWSRVAPADVTTAPYPFVDPAIIGALVRMCEN
ncbi:hypothetical protein C6A85_09240, partial [Mycobacterium sp. ITM-2017-0098]